MASASTPVSTPVSTLVSTPEELPRAIADFLQYLLLCGRAGTQRTAAPILRRLTLWLQARGVDATRATTADLHGYLGYLASEYRSAAGQPLARSSLAGHCAVIKSWFRWLVIRGVLVADPSRSLVMRCVRSRVVVRSPLTLQELTALFQTQAGIVSRLPPGSLPQAQAIRTHAAVCLGLAMGRRISGMTTLRVADIDLVAREIRIEREKGRPGRVLPVAGWAIDAVARYLREARPRLTRGQESPWLFLDVVGSGHVGAQSLGRDLRLLLELTIRENPDLIDLPAKRISWHSLRVSFATLLFTHGCDIRTVNELLLHSCLSSTAAYTPVPIADLQRVFLRAHPRA